MGGGGGDYKNNARLMSAFEYSLLDVSFRSTRFVSVHSVTTTFAHQGSIPYSSTVTELITSPSRPRQQRATCQAQAGLTPITELSTGVGSPPAARHRPLQLMIPPLALRAHLKTPCQSHTDVRTAPVAGVKDIFIACCAATAMPALLYEKSMLGVTRVTNIDCNTSACIKPQGGLLGQPEPALLCMPSLFQHRLKTLPYSSTSFTVKLARMRSSSGLSWSNVGLFVCKRSSYRRLLATPRVVSRRRSHSSP